MKTPFNFQILIVDDSVEMLEIIEIQLSRRGFKVHQASGYDNALNQLINTRINLVISDIEMPGHNGIELLKAIRKMNINLPVLLFSGCIEHYTAEALANGANGLVGKDRMNNLLELVDIYVASY